MSKSAKGTVDNPGRNIKANSGLNKSILDQGWREIRRQLDYKMAWQGGCSVLLTRGTQAGSAADVTMFARITDNPGRNSSVFCVA